MVWQKGQSGNPNGRPVSPYVKQFRDALAKVEGEKGVSLVEHAVRKAYQEKTIMIELLKKVLPDLINQEITHEGNINLGEKVQEFVKHIVERLPSKRNVADPNSGSGTSNTTGSV
jgi:hypothetical protein